MEQLNQLVNRVFEYVNREQFIKYTAGYFVLYLVLNVCFGLFGALGSIMVVLGGLTGAAAAGTVAGAGGVGAGDIAAASGQLVGASIWLLCVSGLSLLSVPLLGAAAFGLYQKTAWARNATLAGIGAMIVLSLIGFSFTSIFWIAASLFVGYIYYADEGIKDILGGKAKA